MNRALRCVIRSFSRPLQQRYSMMCNASPEEVQCDVVVVGGGIVGASTAYELASRGTNVVMLDANHHGKATLAGAGIVSAETDFIKSDKLDRNWLKFADEALKYYAALDKKLVSDAAEMGRTIQTSFHDDTSMLVVATSEGELEAFNRAKAKIDNNSFRVRMDEIPVEKIRQSYRILDEGCAHAGITQSRACRVDGRQFLEALELASSKHKLQVQHTIATRLITDDAKTEVHGVVDARGTRYLAKKVVLAGGAWAFENFASQLTADFPFSALSPQRGQVIRVVNHSDKFWSEAYEGDSDLVISTFRGTYYLLSKKTKEIIIGTTREANSGFKFNNTLGGVHSIADIALHLMPSLYESTIIDIRSGVRPVSPDGKPLLGTVSGMKNLLIGTGLGSDGLLAGPYTGKLLADMATDSLNKAQLPYDIDAFNIQRFN